MFLKPKTFPSGTYLSDDNNTTPQSRNSDIRWTRLMEQIRPLRELLPLADSQSALVDACFLQFCRFHWRPAIQRGTPQNVRCEGIKTSLF